MCLILEIVQFKPYMYSFAIVLLIVMNDDSIAFGIFK